MFARIFFAAAIVAAPLALADDAPADVEALIERLGSDDFQVREAASARLEQLGGPALVAVLIARDSKDFEVAARAQLLVGRWLANDDPTVARGIRRELARLAGGKTTRAGEAQALLAAERAWFQQIGGRVERDDADRITLLHLERRPATDADLRRLAGLDSIERLYLARTRIGDDGLAFVADLQNLRRLSLWETKITDTGLERLAQLSKLEVLDIHSTGVGDAGVARLARLKNLKYLNLSNNRRVTGKSLVALARVSSLTKLDIRGTLVDVTALRAFQTKLPRCNVIY